MIPQLTKSRTRAANHSSVCTGLIPYMIAGTTSHPASATVRQSRSILSML